MEAALRYMLAEYLCETGRWDEAADELELNFQRLRVSGIPALFSWGYQARLAFWRGDVAAAEHALERTRSLTERGSPAAVAAGVRAGRTSRLAALGRARSTTGSLQRGRRSRSGR